VKGAAESSAEVADGSPGEEPVGVRKLSRSFIRPAPSRNRKTNTPFRTQVEGARGALGRSLNQEQPEKSISMGVTGVPGIAFSEFPPLSLLIVKIEGMQSFVPPIKGTNALARIE
jgi:hypothetical protein